MAETNQNRLYTRFILSLKIVQYLGYFIVVFFSLSFVLLTGGVASPGFPPIAFIIVLVQAIFGCLIVYIVTQGLIAIIDLLSRIEQNTRPL